MKEYLIRLIHCHMMGYNVDFGLIYAIMSTQSGESVADRRVGYIASTLFIENDSELTIMLTNTLQRVSFMLFLLWNVYIGSEHLLRRICKVPTFKIAVLR
jgi:hypothetical protein